VLMVRTHETRLVYEADSFEEAIKIAEQDEDRYHAELEQMCVVEEYFREA
jgi:hypothetical protein